MVSMLASSAEDRGFKPWSGQAKDYEIGICCFSAWNQDNVFDWGNMSIHELLFQWASTRKIQLSVLV